MSPERLVKSAWHLAGHLGRYALSFIEQPAPEPTQPASITYYGTGAGNAEGS